MYSVARSGSSFIRGISVEYLRDRKAEVASGAGRAFPVELLQFNLSKPVASVIISCEQLPPLEQNGQAAMNFTPISESGKQRTTRKSRP